MGNVMIYGGIGGIVVSLLAMLICARVFPRQRRKMLKKLGEE